MVCMRMTMHILNQKTAPDLRYIPQDWLNPIPLRALFPNPKQPITVDVGSGKARFILHRSAAEPTVNFLGIDRMLKRIRKTAKKATRADIQNLRLLRLDAYYAVTYLIPDRSVNTYFVLFPDPWPKKKHAANRLMSPSFLDALARTMVVGGILHFATDHQPYFSDCMDLLTSDLRFETIQSWSPTDEERTDFELMFRDQKPIGRASFRLRPC